MGICDPPTYHRHDFYLQYVPSVTLCRATYDPNYGEPCTGIYLTTNMFGPSLTVAAAKLYCNQMSYPGECDAFLQRGDFAGKFNFYRLRTESKWDDTFSNFIDSASWVGSDDVLYYAIDECSFPPPPPPLPLPPPPPSPSPPPPPPPPPPPSFSPSPPPPLPPLPSPPPPSPPPSYTSGGCGAFFVPFDQSSDRFFTTENRNLNQASADDKIPQPTFEILQADVGTKDQFVAHLGDSSKRESFDYQPLYYQVTNSKGSAMAAKASVDNAKCQELCRWWAEHDENNGCVAHEYWTWDGANGHRYGQSPGPTSGDGKFMRCELWVWPRTVAGYGVSGEDDKTFCSAACVGGGGSGGGDASCRSGASASGFTNRIDLEDATLRPTQDTPPEIGRRLQAQSGAASSAADPARAQRRLGRAEEKETCARLLETHADHHGVADERCFPSQSDLSEHRDPDKSRQPTDRSYMCLLLPYAPPPPPPPPPFTSSD